MYRLRHIGLFKCIHNHNNWYIITNFPLIILKLVRKTFQLHSACGISHNITFLYVELPQKYNYIVYFNAQPKLTKLVAMATFILFRQCLKIEFCQYNAKRNINLTRMKQCHRYFSWYMPICIQYEERWIWGWGYIYEFFFNYIWTIVTNDMSF